MTEVAVGSWIVDLAAGTAREGDLVVTVASEPNGTFSVHYSGDVPIERRYQIGREALEVFERAQALVMWQKSVLPDEGSET